MSDVNDAGAWVGWAGSAGIGLALGLGLLYLVLRGTAWSPGRGDPVRAVRTHAMITALIALFASSTTGLSQLANAEEYQVFGNGAFPVTTETEGETVREVISAPVPGLTWFDGLSIILGPVLGFVLVYAVAQYTWPRQSGAVRTARLKDRRPADLMPRYLTAFTALISVAALGLVALAWTTVGVEARQIEERWGNGEPGSAAWDQGYGGENSWFEPGVRAGTEVAPWLLLALALVLAGFVLVLRTIARRPVLNGLHPHDDLLVRRIAVNRALRTAAVMVLGIGQAGFNTWAEAEAALAVRSADPSSTPFMPWPVLASLLVLLILLFWRSPHISELGAHTVTGTEGHDAGPSSRAVASAARPGTARAVLRLRLDGAVLAWISVVPIGVVAVAVLAFAAAAPTDRGGPWALLLWTALPFCAALLILGLTEFGVRRGHSPAEAPSTTGQSSRWPLVALGLALLLATAWSMLCLAARVPQTELGTALAATTAGFALLSLALARLALRRPALGRATAEQDAAIRAGGANRILAVGAAGVFAATGAALLAGVQVWNGFITSAVLDLGINDLPDDLLMIRGLLLFVLFGLIVACLIAPAPEVPGVKTPRGAARSVQSVHAEQGGSLR
ncbi:hypothetical protein [Citricoccus nitrophenolicus]|uniref:hypothetical protein n=1 Tax=Citricoccus nitrophenolicus TaxID=863575 RepID=UPI0031EA30E3